MRNGISLAAAIALVAIGAIGVVCSLLVFDAERRADNARVQALLELRVEWRARDFEYKIRRDVDSVGVLANYIAVEDNLDAKRFHRFAQLRHTENDPASALSWYPWVDGQERAAFVAAARQDNPDLEIREITPQDRFVPAAERAAYLPGLYEETFDDTPGVLGFDLLFRPERKAQVEHVRDTGRPLATPVFSMLLGGERVAGFLALWPVYTTGAVPSTVEERRSGFRGMAVGRFRLDRLLPEAIAGTPEIVETIDFLVDRGRAGDAPQLAASYDPVTAKFTSGAPSNGAAGKSLELRRELDVYGRDWTLVSGFSDATVGSLRSNGPWIWLVAGLLITGLITVLFRREQVQRGAVERAVKDRTAELSLANSSLSQEIMERRRSEQLARESEERLSHAQSLAHMGRVSVNLRTGETSWSDEVYRILGVSRETFAPLPEDYLRMVHPDDRATVSATQKQVRQGMPAKPMEYRVIQPDGTVRWIYRESEVVRDETGDSSYLNSTIQDITERRQTEEQLRQAQKMEAVGNLTGGLAHDFNNLLGVVIGNLDLLRERQTGDADADELARESLDAALRGADLTRRLLAFARRQPLQPTRTDVNRLIAGIVKLLERTLGEEIQITLDLSHDTWPVVVDPAQLESSLTNLATNARDAMPNGGQLIIVTGNRSLDADYASQHADVEPGDYAVIEVSDTGTGMPPEVESHIFEPFYTTKEEGKGTGLGLSMVFGFMKQSGGHINVYSEVGIGTTIRLFLQRADAGAEASGAVVPTALVRGSGETVLAVEDNASLRRVVVRQLTELGYRVVEAEDAQSALRVLDAEPVDLIFTDIVMPGGTSGYELARTVLSLWPAIKIVLTSGFPENKINDDGDATERHLRLLSKPYRRDDLGRLIREVLDS
jgi:PAS domain S-box-containing protein